MESCHTVYGIAGCNSKMRHFHLAVINNCHLADFFLIVWIHFLDSQDKSAVNLLNNLIDSGKQSGEQLDRPFFQCLCHNSMIGVRTGFAGNLPCLLPSKIILIHQDSHKLSYRHGRMGIIKLEGNLLIKLANIIMLAHILAHCRLYGSGDKKVLLR